MLKINRKVEYALIVLNHFQYKEKSHEYTTARMIADHYHIPFDTTAKVMQLMNNHHILESLQGVKGGYKLKTPLSHINYYQLSEIIEERKYQNLCETKCNLASTCSIVIPIKRFTNKMNHFFRNLSIQEILEYNYE